jgi:hypothetical protein
MLYLTPARFREMGFGIDVSELDDAEIMALASQASAVVNAYCNVPRQPQPHDLLGGTITGEQHPWRMPFGPGDLGQRRVYLMHKPIISVERFRIYVTNTQYVEIAPTEVMINHLEGYFEVVSLVITSSGLFNALIIPNVGLATPLATTDYTYGRDHLVTDEQLVCTDGQTWRAQNQFWYTDAERTPSVTINGVAVDPMVDPYTVDATEGTIVFEANRPAEDVVRATYHHKLPPEVQYGTGHIMAYLHGQAELHARGMAHLNRLRVAEVDMTRQNLPSAQSLSQNLYQLVPEAALLLDGIAAENITVR